LVATQPPRIPREFFGFRASTIRNTSKILKFEPSGGADRSIDFQTSDSQTVTASLNPALIVEPLAANPQPQNQASQREIGLMQGAG
jgi:hypothetical protein